MQIAYGKLKILKEGRARKFVNNVEQITFAGPYAAKKSQPVLYATERCVFQLTPGGLELIEVAPGIDIEKHILAHMDFPPIINKPIPMDRRIFMDEPMELLSELMNLLSERISYDAGRNILFVNLEGWSVRKKATSTICAMRWSRRVLRPDGGSTRSSITMWPPDCGRSLRQLRRDDPIHVGEPLLDHCALHHQRVPAA